MTEKFDRLQAERDAAIQLAEEMEQKLLAQRDEMEEAMEKGYEEAYGLLMDQKSKAEKLAQEKAALEEQVEALTAQNNRLLSISGTDKKYADAFDQEIIQKECSLYNEFDGRMKKQREMMVTKLDQFMQHKYAEIEEHIALKAIADAIEQGGEALLKEVLGDEAVTLYRTEQQAAEAQKEQEERIAQRRVEEAKQIREATQQAQVEDHNKQVRQMVKNVAQRKASSGKIGRGTKGTWPAVGYAEGGALSKAFGDPYYGKLTIGPTVADQVQKRADELEKKDSDTA